MAESHEPKACIILLDLPPTIFCGIDLLSFTTNRKFKGIRNLPPGWHFLFTGATSDLSVRHGYWFYVNDDEEDHPHMSIMRWDTGREELKPETTQNELHRWRANLGSIWRQGLTPYRQTATGNSDGPTSDPSLVEEKADWGQLTYGISRHLQSRILGSEESGCWSLTSASCASEDEDHIPGLSLEHIVEYKEKTLRFLSIDLKRTWREGAVGRERTEAAQDRSWALERLTSNQCEHVSDIIGELNFAFLMVLTLNNYSCMEQWKRLLTLVTTCSQAVVKQPTFFTQFLDCLKKQLEHGGDADGGLFDLSDESGNLLSALLERFRAGLRDYSGTAKSDVIDSLDDLEEYMRSTYGWTMNEESVKKSALGLNDGGRVDMQMNGLAHEEEDDDYAPTLVELTPGQAQELYGDEHDVRLVTHNFRAAAEEEQIASSDDEKTSDFEEMDPRFLNSVTE
ncbi:MAG: hypothetical protein M1828_004373 [Chrysothrix sp. TS-e1954]|nr:MAG: hypothetical protein M1828_004373 [Chrysothrix sp. TS-e1954]